MRGPRGLLYHSNWLASSKEDDRAASWRLIIFSSLWTLGISFQHFSLPDTLIARYYFFFLKVEDDTNSSAVLATQLCDASRGEECAPVFLFQGEPRWERKADCRRWLKFIFKVGFRKTRHWEDKLRKSLGLTPYRIYSPLLQWQERCIAAS